MARVSTAGGEGRGVLLSFFLLVVWRVILYGYTSDILFPSNTRIPLIFLVNRVHSKTIPDARPPGAALGHPHALSMSHEPPQVSSTWCPAAPAVVEWLLCRPMPMPSLSIRRHRTCGTSFSGQPAQVGLIFKNIHTRNSAGHRTFLM